MIQLNSDSFSPFTSSPFASAPGRGVIAAERRGLAIASVIARTGRIADLEQSVRRGFGIELPRGPRHAGVGEVAFVGLGVGSWLAVSGGDAGFAAALHQAVADCAAISDQSGGYALLRLTGPKIRNTLAKLLPIDLHPRVFHVAAAASTLTSHMPVRLWRLEDAPGGSAVFEMAVARSFAASFWQALVESAAEFGLAVA
ncbi:MAG: sarcosine oxidase subunit gamma [Steroidobacteraceae bacterium]